MIVRWIRPSRPDATTTGVQARRHGVRIEVRHSSNPHGPVLSYTDTQWAAFLRAVKDGKFDHLLNH